ncbi:MULTISPECIES: VIT family protein [unclassified Bosea (in: a-proteobacteria)]|uniref:VIT1/CCC1 transporter family protein n=1 Tax=unclassified Bosea (in: a-proteobacteria) TaxID=2653178 RepID=UPI0009572721|nr:MULTISPECIES: VIT family protein [unclassified Bosea (in: a-proteobacteria)]TAJ28053.1 MAG: VIT family protein [Bosea sp. (in: a-proteobacteria)]SIR06194.1 Predicted Fe2+/Mn2+ transporter, VIT1/CCC1 family [Bosea sp. TND4EK4]
MRALHKENHLIERIGWLRAAVLGANDGLISTSSLIVGVAAATAASDEILVAGVAGLVAGAMSMAAGEYVSVSSQADTEQADMARERNELANQPEAELAELAAIYAQRGVSPDLAQQVAKQMMEKDALEAHARDELGLSSHVMAKPVQAAFTSAVTFSAGAALPLIVALLTPAGTAAWSVSIAGLIGLAALGAIGARAGGASIWKPTARVMFWGAVAMASTAGIGSLVGRGVGP